MRTIEYFVLSTMAIAGAYMLATTVAGSVSASMARSAELIRTAR